MTRSLLALTMTVVLSACAAPERAATTAEPISAAQPSRAARLDALYESYFEDSLQLNPLQATQLGDRRYNDRLPNMLTAAFREQSRALNADYLARAEAIGDAGLAGQDLLSWQLFVDKRRNDIEALQYPRHLAPLNQFYSFASQFATLGSGTTAQPFKTVEDYDNWLKRARAIPAVFDQAIANMREGMRQGITQPQVIMAKVLPQLDAQIVTKAADSTYFGPIKALPAAFDASERERLQRDFTALIENDLVPAHRRLRDFIANEYLPVARTSIGLSELPNGNAWYAFQVRQSTTTALSPEQIHQIGLDEVARIHGQMRQLQQRMAIEGSLTDFFAAMKADPANYFASEDELLKAYRDFRATVEPRLPALFDIKPKADFEIRPVEAFRAASAAGGQYNAPSEDGSRPGIFYVNTYDLKSRPRWALESLYLHEATPGHHFHIALQRELTDLPRFRRFGGETAFAEGWGLYAESLGPELGVYTDPAMHFGALSAELWRAIRLVTDTGIHAKGWTRQQVLDYMYANSAAAETQAISEAERFIAIPGQALAYKIGELKIRELRTRAEQKLGARFDIKAFHRQVLQDGSLPLSLLEAKIDRWTASVPSA
jgi:uncharacterized protein (DUF885 family)